MDKIKLLIADDHPIFRYGLREILELQNDFLVIGEASNGGEAVTKALEFSPDIILMDLFMPEITGIQAIEKLMEENTSLKIIALTICKESEYLFKTINLGASGYVLKDSDPKILIDAIRKVHSGETYIQQSLMNELVHEFNRISQGTSLYIDNDSCLTHREIEVIRLLAKGFSNKEIARNLKISEKTVKNHVANIFRKLNVYDRTQAAIYAFKHNL